MNTNKLLLKARKRLMAFRDMFKDNNDINEKNVVGFASFAVMVLFAAADIITGALGKELVITDTVFKDRKSNV